jgi:RNA polymerase sigma-70 factor (family 1)
MSIDLNEPLVRQIAEGNHNAFRNLYKAYKSHTFKFAMHMLHDVEEAENIVHDLFAKIWDNRKKIRPDQNFKSFLFTCLRNMILDHLKREQRNQSAFKYYLLETSKKEESIAQKEEKYKLIQLALNKLSDKRRDIIYMCFVDGKSYQEIADIHAISKNTVKNQLVKAKQFLRSHLASQLRLSQN